MLPDDPQKLYIRERITCRVEIDGKVFHFEQQILDLEGKGIITNQPDLAGGRLAVGTKLLVRYYRSDSAYQFMSEVLGTEERNTIPVMRLSFPSRITRYQRRKTIRVKIEGTIQATILGREAVLRGYIINISEGGLLCSLPAVEQFADKIRIIGLPVQLGFTMTTGDVFTEIIGTIVRIEKTPNSKTHLNIQIVFDSVYEKQQKQISKMVLKIVGKT
jgi:c-di-GMP-binding flagellar brake protein YcgR